MYLAHLVRIPGRAAILKRGPTQWAVSSRLGGLTGDLQIPAQKTKFLFSLTSDGADLGAPGKSFVKNDTEVFFLVDTFEVMFA